MKKLKPGFIITLTLITLMILTMLTLLGIWIWRLNDQIQVSLKNKSFLPPTSYYSNLTQFSKFTIDWDINRVKSELSRRMYLEKSSDRKLSSGEYTWLSAMECVQSMPSAPSGDLESCLLFEIKDLQDPSVPTVNSSFLQLIAFGKANDKSGQILEVYQGNPLMPAENAILESELLGQYYNDQPISQNYTELSNIPPSCLNGVLAIEDNRFLDHKGVSFIAIARAAFNNLRGGHKQGGSTITQQLVKNYFLTSEQTIKRKAIEFFMSLLLEINSSKDEILETYLNIIYLGQNGSFQLRGFPAASQYYFQKPISDLNVSQCASMAALLNNPGLYNPFKNPDRLKKRRDIVLQKMLEYSLISPEEKNAAENDPMPIANPRMASETSPYYLDAVKKELRAQKVELVGTKIFTGLTPSEQKRAQEATIKTLSQLESSNPTVKALLAKSIYIEPVLISIDNKSGLVEAIVGGRNFKTSPFNRAIDAKRQVGSLAKPFVYLAALSNQPNSYNAMTPILDESFDWKIANNTWTPENYTKEFFGEVPLYVALKKSLNVATARLAQDVGVKPIIEQLKLAGISTDIPELPSISLGAFETTPLFMGQAYSTIANQGELHPVHFVRGYVTSEGDTHKTEITGSMKLNPEAADILISMMKYTNISGTAPVIGLAKLPFASSGKTGTTSDYKDAWYAGFTPEKTIITWVGTDSNYSHRLTGGSTPAAIWLDFAKGITYRNDKVDFLLGPNVTLEKKEVLEKFEAKKEADLVFRK